MNTPFPNDLRIGPGIAAGVDEPMIQMLVHGFYDQVRTDPILGPIFDREIDGEWDAHLQKMCDFWSSVLLMTGRFKGAPMVVHARIADIDVAHFMRWLRLFHEAASELCPPDAAALFIEKSEIIARRLQLGIAARRSVSSASVRQEQVGHADPIAQEGAACP